MADGLDALTSMRTRSTSSRRTLPAPRHQPRDTPVSLPEQPEPPAAPTSSASPTPPPTAPPGPQPAATAAEQLTKASIYLDEPAGNFLDTVSMDARRARPKVDATRSAVVRLALKRMAEQMSSAEVVAELQRSAATHTGPGRKRA